jgi:hypothetical protein
MLEAWLKAAEASLTASLDTQTSEQAFSPMLALQERQEKQNLLGEVLAWHAMLQSLWEDHGQEALLLCQRALALLFPENTPNLDGLLAAFPKPRQAQKRLPKQRKRERLP